MPPSVCFQIACRSNAESRRATQKHLYPMLCVSHLQMSSELSDYCGCWLKGAKSLLSLPEFHTERRGGLNAQQPNIKQDVWNGLQCQSNRMISSLTVCRHFQMKTKYSYNGVVVAWESDELPSAFFLVENWSVTTPLGTDNAPAKIYWNSNIVGLWLIPMAMPG